MENFITTNQDDPFHPIQFDVEFHNYQHGKCGDILTSSPAPPYLQFYILIHTSTDQAAGDVCIVPSNSNPLLNEPLMFEAICEPDPDNFWKNICHITDIHHVLFWQKYYQMKTLKLS